MSNSALRGLASWAGAWRIRAKSGLPGVAMAVSFMLLSGGPALGADVHVPSTFIDTIGSGLLCRDQIDPYFYWSYMNEFFGPPYKNEGGAYWFRVKASLWGVPISDVLVSDGTNPVIFLAAAAQVKPGELSKAIQDNAGIPYAEDDAGQYSPFQSGYGSRIIYFGQESKIYCTRRNLDYYRNEH